MFTNGQINIMRNILEIARPELINEEASLSNNEIISLNNHKKVIKIIDILGRESSNQNFNHLKQENHKFMVTINPNYYD